MIGPLRILRRWRPAANLVDELPVLSIPAVMDDDDVDFWGDMLYLRGLLEHLEKACLHSSEPRLAPWDDGGSAELDAALEMVREFWVVPA